MRAGLHYAAASLYSAILDPGDSHMVRAKVLDARWSGEVSVSTISPQV